MAIDEIVGYWFGNSDDDGEVAKQQSKLWWQHDPDIDRELGERFGSLVEQAGAGELDPWVETPRGRLALILLLDQLPRAIYRGTPRAFETDDKALGLAREGLQFKMDHQLRYIERLFFLLPLEHAEDVEAQQQSVRRFLELEAEVAPPLRPAFGGFVEYAVRHRDVIERFGRFPHRNEILGRESTAEEEAFLKEPASSF